MKYYLDIETSGLDFNKDRILTIQTSLINENNKTFEDFIIRVAWQEEDEYKILKDFWEWYNNLINKYGIFGIVPVGYNLQFDLTFLYLKAKKYKINVPYNSFYTYIFKTPYLDLRNIVIFMLKGRFKGSSLSAITNKKTDGNVVLNYLANKEHNKIVKYIYDETKSFEDFYFWLLDNLHKDLEKWDIYKNKIKNEN